MHKLFEFLPKIVIFVIMRVYKNIYGTRNPNTSTYNIRGSEMWHG